VTRPSNPWEYTDGAIYLLRELCSSAPVQASHLLPALADVTSLTHFPQADTLRETAWKLLPTMAAALGKPLFKAHLKELLSPLFDTLSRPATHQLAGEFRSRNATSRQSDATHFQYLCYSKMCNSTSVDSSSGSSRWSNIISIAVHNGMQQGICRTDSAAVLVAALVASCAFAPVLTLTEQRTPKCLNTLTSTMQRMQQVLV
jgi:hypothetical protein